jgi:hypothetical protein
MGEQNSSRELATHFWRIVAAVLVIAALISLIPLAILWSKSGLPLKDAMGLFGSFGDMFGALSAIFSGIAFAAIYYALLLQQKQYEVQLTELNMKREIARLAINESESRQTFRTTVLGNEGRLCPARYARLVLENTARMPAKGCRVLLTKIEKRTAGKPYSVIPESKLTLRLTQPIEDEGASEDKTFVIPHNLPHYFNICSIKEDPPSAEPHARLQVAHQLSKYKALGTQITLGCEYRFYIAVDSENSVPLSVIVEVSIGTDIESLSVENLVVQENPGEAVYVK